METSKELSPATTFTLTDKDSTVIKSVVIGLFGATIQKIIIDDGKFLRNIAVGFDTPEEYAPPLRPKQHNYYGSTVGRYANRIKNGEFTLNANHHMLSRNNGPNALHGGP